MKAMPRAAAAVLALAALSACQQLPKGLPYSVTGDCQVQRRAAAPLPSTFVATATTTPEAKSAASTMVLAHTPLARSGAASRGRTAVDVAAVSGDHSRLPAASESRGRNAGSESDRSRGGSYPGESRRGGFGFGFGLGFGLPAMPAAEPDAAELLVQSGPQFPENFSMSCAPVQAFVRGGWPVVIDYEPDGQSDVVLEIHTVTATNPYVVALESAAGRRLRKLDLPAPMGDSAQVALFLVRATKRPEKAPGRVQLFGLGAGPRAVGSVAIDQVEFKPSAMRVSQRQKASYSFYSRSDFNRSVVEILRVRRSAEEIRVSLARSNPLEFGINRGTWVGKKEPLTWDGMDGNNHVSSGPHLLQVRAWLNSQDARDWVAAWSPGMVVVSE
jgi:hypothetical protein